MIKYSIIIPHYNCPDLLMRCLRSIPINEEIQVIVIDDCSPNFDKYKELYPELSRPYLELYSTGSNGGGGKARNVGLRYVKGEWVIFADADDFFVAGLIEIFNLYYGSSADIVYFRVKSCYEDDVNTEIKGHKEELYNIYNKRKDSRIFRYCYTEPWGKMFKKNLIIDNNIQFEEVIVANDFLFSVKTGFYAQNIEISDIYLYWYVLMHKSTSRGHQSQSKIEARLIEKVKVQQFLDDHNVICDYNLLSYVSRLKSFCPIISSSEFKIFKQMSYPIFPVIKDRIRLLFSRLFVRDTSLNPNTRKFY